MLRRGSPAAVMIGRWGMAVALVIGAVLVGRVIRRFPYLLPNRLPGLVIHELGPGLALALAIGAAVIATRDSDPPLTAPGRLSLFMLVAIIAGVVVIGWEFTPSLQGRWF